MQRTVITYGLIAGLIILVLGYAQWTIMMGGDWNMDMSTGTLLGFVSMIISLSMVFFGVRQFRDRHLDGKITFGRAFIAGFLISMIGAAFYVIGWMIFYHTSDAAQTFNAHYLEYMKEQWTSAGMSTEEIKEKVAGYEKNMELYNNNLVVMAGMTLMEILPVGLLISLISALILKRK